MEYEIRRDNDHNGEADNIFPTNPRMIPAVFLGAGCRAHWHTEAEISRKKMSLKNARLLPLAAFSSPRSGLELDVSVICN